ncbi:RHS repeat-associated core domain-containing protein [Photorhabdus caribbeanensis]|uniref:RHS repeat domain-containing protein n=1 Tax=Photorhabdus caribbeanensis TaxID=1004165 RepID=UPI0030EF0200
MWRRPKQSLYGLRLGRHGENPQLDPGLRFAGQIFDEESGLCYNRFRYYLLEGCCYLSADPIGLEGGANHYAYVENPTSWFDPLGLTPEKGIATVLWHDNRGPGNSFGHYSVKIEFGGQTIHTHQFGGLGPNGPSQTKISTRGIQNVPVDKIGVFELPNGKAALDFQKSVLEKVGPLYDTKTRSCVTHVMEVLKAGGMDVPNEAGGQFKFLLKNMKKCQKPGE